MLHVTEKNGYVEITGLTAFDLARTLECGQCFRWERDPTDETGVTYTGVAQGLAATVRQADDAITITGSLEDFERIWRGYFDLDRDYGAIERALCVDEYMTCAVAHGAGIRILRQDPWEALVSFILSQCSNIPRIKQNIDALCRSFGAAIPSGGQALYAFPSAEALARLTIEDLAPIRAGYRTPYILSAARAVADGTIDLNALTHAPPDTAIETLKRLDGVGDKVAGCVMLFGLHQLAAFPVDTWIKKALRDNYGKQFDHRVFGEHAGVAQQYIFHYARNIARTNT